MMVPMDPLLMEQVLVNLMENAVIHGETHHIDVTLSSEGNCAVFTVADDGRGIPQHLLPRLFDLTGLEMTQMVADFITFLCSGGMLLHFFRTELAREGEKSPAPAERKM